jgi:hypothetical protein
LGRLYESMSDRHKDFIDALDPLNIQSRYWEDRQRLSRALTPDKCKAILKQTEEAYGWIKATL